MKPNGALVDRYVVNPGMTALTAPATLLAFRRKLLFAIRDTHLLSPM